MSKIIWPAFLLMVLAQWWVPGKMILSKEQVLSRGTLYKFLSAPVDPNDPFRGKYIVLNFKENVFKFHGPRRMSYGAKVYVTYARDQKGFARIQSLSETKPQRADYLETTVDYSRNEHDSTYVYIKYPFTVFYMEESKAPAAAAIYGKRVIDSSQKTYALVSLLNGDAVIKDVYINDTSIHTLINRERAARR